ncbi:Decarbamoylnovobiocin carbamoyltransferase [Enhygromyxa salina]|uniref:Decarbamoylnovobiocin carbamoyltransferase n=1 Tax=Enhygromyxa salina TaxID=215803 RepID=A0A2S9YBC1_9BACT|nr:carbamoyltransferase C-terminal domain-containing protein [Enhygromyxa salina]PRQ02403.1 Decarbamoylnovobiocin carbamoyltransferase [Enhygromyxa salina]
MRVIGICGGLNTDTRRSLPEGRAYAHDAAASLLVDGELVAASEQERHTRWKHTTRHPVDAVATCLELGGLGPEDIDRWAYYVAEDKLDEIIAYAALHDSSLVDVGGRELLARTLGEALGATIDPAKLCFVSHHVAHAVSAYAGSGFTDSLVVSYDGGGDDGHGKIFDVRGGRYRLLARLAKDGSLGQFYAKSIAHLGYARFDEYKVMGLAPYGDPARYLPTLRQAYTLEPRGHVRVELAALEGLDLGPRRARGGPFEPHHHDVAAAIQAALEEMAFHLIGAWQRATGQRKLCLVGGVALNCSFNGKLLARGWFDELFVQPAAHDAGCSLGAAIHAYQEAEARPPVSPLRHVFVGSPCPEAKDLEAELQRWSALLSYERCADAPAAAAARLAAGEVIGWFQGRSEFGPRALGNRSILADPRPASNKDRVNAMIKKREAYRPFAPSVLEDRAAELFELDGPARCYRYMNVVAEVRPEQRERLGAVTHVDGSARVQTVSRATNPRYSALIEAFADLTGLPVVLNTSFNNFAEPIVDAPRDAIVCFLTTGLDRLVIGDFVVSKGEVAAERPAALAQLVPSLPSYARLDGEAIELAPPRERRLALAPELARALAEADGVRTLAELLGAAPSSTLAASVFELWQERAVCLAPRGA